MPQDTYANFLLRWDSLVGPEYHLATAKVPTIDGWQTTYVSVQRWADYTWKMLADRFSGKSIEGDRERLLWLGEIQLLMYPYAEYIHRR